MNADHNHDGSLGIKMDLGTDKVVGKTYAVEVITNGVRLQSRASSGTYPLSPRYTFEVANG